MNGKNINEFSELESPGIFRKKYSLSSKAEKTVVDTREIISKILDGKDLRKMFIVGPCSVHNYDEAIEYAKKIKEISDKVKDKIVILMRVYLEKSRTSIGWKGFINDPDLNNSFDISNGISTSRKLLNEINELGVPVATEFLDIAVSPYLYDFVSWGTIGARTTESQTHRQMVSGFPMPMGFKNSTSGVIETAINAIKTAGNSHHYIGINDDGKVSILNTKGNSFTHLILRGGDNGPNYEEEFVKEALDRLNEKNLRRKLIIDCSHGNSLKDYKRQSQVFGDVVMQMKNNKDIIGLMLESGLEEGRQDIPEDLSKLKHGVSITDSCMGIVETEKLINSAVGIL